MSTESSQSSGESLSPHTSTASQQSTQTLSSDEEIPEGEEESSKGGSPADEEEDYDSLAEYDSLEEKPSLRGKEDLYELEELEEEEHPQKEKGLKENECLYEDEYLEQGQDDTADPFGPWKAPPDAAEFEGIYSLQTSLTLNARSPTAGVSQAATCLHGPPPTSDPASEPPHCLPEPSASFEKDSGELLTRQDQATQTEYAYKTAAPSKLKLKAKKESSTTTLNTLEMDSEVMQSVSQRTLQDDIVNEPTDTLDIEDLDDNLSKSSYQAVFRAMLREMAARSELEEDIDIPLTGHLESETRRKLGILLKTNFETYKETIQWIMKKRENLLSRQAPETYSFHVTTNLSWHVEEPEIEVQKPRRTVRRKKQIEIDTKSVKYIAEVHQGDVKLIFYPNETISQILFPDGSGQIHYPSGRLALLILSMEDSKYTYIILEDSQKAYVRALINNTGHATFYDEQGEIWLSLSQNLGYYFAKGKPQKAWNWWNLNIHVHAPPVQSISLTINQHIQVQIRSQDNIIFCFIHKTKPVRLNMGTKYKFIVPELLSEMKKKAILEVEFSSTARKIQILLGNMRRILKFLTICDLENFLEGSRSCRRTARVRGETLHP